MPATPSSNRLFSLLRRIAPWPLTPPHPPVSGAQVVAWWETRRLPYNLLVGVCGVTSLIVFFLAIAASGALQPGEDAVEPLGLLAAFILAPIAANVCYTLGWLVELIVRRLRPKLTPAFGPALFAIGLTFSCFIVSIPAIFWLAYLVLQGLAHLF